MTDWDTAEVRTPAPRRQRPERDGQANRFAIGFTLFLLVAILYPWYAYRVDSFLAERELAEASRQMARLVDEDLRAMHEAGKRAEESTRRKQQLDRIARVRVKGVSDGPMGPVAIVDLGTAGVAEAQATICAQAARMSRQAGSNGSLRLQRYRGSQPAVDAGMIDCAN
jgi:hypothetical protein